MSEGEYLTSMIEGAELSMNNARRLLQDAQPLFGNGKYTSSFLLSQLSLEEQAEAFKLIGKHLKKKTFSKREWEDFAHGVRAHREKLKYIQNVIDALDAENMKKQTDIDFWQVLKKMRQSQGERSLDAHRKKISKEWTEVRFATLYTEYDFANRKWIGAQQIDPVRSLRSKATAERLLKYLEYQILKVEKGVES